MFKKTKLRRKTIEELAGELRCLSEIEQQFFLGGYKNDCFWRCLAWIFSGGSHSTEKDAERIALPYFQQQNIQVSYDTGESSQTEETSVDETLRTEGAGVTVAQMWDYVSSYYTEYGNWPVGPNGEHIGYYRTDEIPPYKTPGTWHVVIVLENNLDGSKTLLDPATEDQTEVNCVEGKNVRILI